MITEKQRRLIQALVVERAVPGNWYGMATAVAYGDRQITAGAARSLIEILKGAPRR